MGSSKLYDELPKEGSTYTIRDIVPGIGLTGDEGEIAVYLCEIKGPLNAHGIERGFRADRFAPLTTADGRQRTRRCSLVFRTCFRLDGIPIGMLLLTYAACSSPSCSSS